MGANKLTIGDKTQNLLTDEEVSNLNIPKGTLTPEEEKLLTTIFQLLLRCLSNCHTQKI